MEGVRQGLSGFFGIIFLCVVLWIVCLFAQCVIAFLRGWKMYRQELGSNRWVGEILILHCLVGESGSKQITTTSRCVSSLPANCEIEWITFKGARAGTLPFVYAFIVGAGGSKTDDVLFAQKVAVSNRDVRFDLVYPIKSGNVPVDGFLQIIVVGAENEKVYKIMFVPIHTDVS